MSRQDPLKEAFKDANQSIYDDWFLRTLLLFFQQGSLKKEPIKSVAQETAHPQSPPQNLTAISVKAFEPPIKIPEALSPTPVSAPEPFPILPQGARVITEGDSHMNGYGAFLKAHGVNVENLGVDGAGLLCAKKVNDIPADAKNAIVVMSIGTNDVGAFVGMDPARQDAAIAKYAHDVAARAERAASQGNMVYLLSINPPKDGKYLGGATQWNDPKFQDEWKNAAEKINAAYKTAVADANKTKNPNQPGVTFKDISSLADMRVADKLHYTGAAYNVLESMTLAKPVS